MDAEIPPTAAAAAAAEYWCHHCDKRVSVESVPDQPDLICSDCKFGFVESINININIPVIDEPTLGSQFLQVLRLLSQVSRDQPQPPSRASSDPDHPLHQDPQQDDDDDDEEEEDDDVDDDDEEEEGSVRSVEIRGDSGDDNDTEEDILRRQRRDLLRLRLRDFAIRARPAGRNRILDWADILMGLDNNNNNNSITDHLYVGNPGDYANDAEYHTLLQNLADAEGRRGAPPASKAAVHALNSLQLHDASFVCAICKEGLAVGDSLKEMPCTHAYHAHCIVPWLAARNTCPVCRFELPTDDPDYEEDKRKTSPTTATSSSSSSSSAPTS